MQGLRQASLDNLPNLPDRYLLEDPRENTRWNSDTCAKFPLLQDLQFNNIYWQVLKVKMSSFYLYSAFYDDRMLSAPRPSVRVLGMINRNVILFDVYCQLWFDEVPSPVISKISEFSFIWNKAWDTPKDWELHPYLMLCQIPPACKHLVPQSVSLVSTSCDTATNNLKVINNQPQKGKKADFAVCVKGMNFVYDDRSVRLVEWLELLFILGVNKVFLYELALHPNITKVINYYRNKKRVEIKKLTLPGELPNVSSLISIFYTAKRFEKRHYEVIPYNDCLYNNMNLYKFIAVFDVDEIIMPNSFTSWKSLMEAVAPAAMSGEQYLISSYCARHVYFLDFLQEEDDRLRDVPSNLHMLQHRYRADHYHWSEDQDKCLHNPKRVVHMHHHRPFLCQPRYCGHFNFDTADAQLQHYRHTCLDNEKSNCSDYSTQKVLDDNILRFQKQLLKRTEETLRHLGLS